MVVADVNAVPPPGSRAWSLFDDGTAMPGIDALGVGALAIGNVKFRCEHGLVKQMSDAASRWPLGFDDAYALRRGGTPLGEPLLICALSGRALAQSARDAGSPRSCRPVR